MRDDAFYGELSWSFKFHREGFRGAWPTSMIENHQARTQKENRRERVKRNEPIPCRFREKSAAQKRSHGCRWEVLCDGISVKHVQRMLWLTKSRTFCLPKWLLFTLRMFSAGISNHYICSRGFKRPSNELEQAIRCHTSCHLPPECQPADLLPL